MFFNPKIAPGPLDLSVLTDNIFPLADRLETIELTSAEVFSQCLPTTFDGSTIFHVLLCQEFPDKLEILRAILNKKIDLNKKNNYGDTGLILLAFRNNEAVMRLLLEFPGIDTYAKNNGGNDAATILQQRHQNTNLIEFIKKYTLQPVAEKPMTVEPAALPEAEQPEKPVECSPSLQPLVELTELEIKYHQAEEQSAHDEFKKLIQRYNDRFLLSVSTCVAGTDEQSIQYILFLPKTAKQESIPLIIHTHGGPHVCMTESTLHAQITYFISKGFAVACPNYRGSSPAPFPSGKAFETADKKQLHLLAAEDVYSVTQHVLATQPMLDASRVMLRGGSFGSHVNAHLLAEIARGTYPQLYCAAQFFGGIEYPMTADFPRDIPLQFLHGCEDDIAPYQPVKTLVENLLLSRIHQDIENNVAVQFFKNADHHLIPLRQDKSVDKAKLPANLAAVSEFVESVFAGTYRSPTAEDQLFALVDSAPERAKAYAYVNALPVHEQPQIIATPANSESRRSPTLAHLSLILEDQFTGNIETDLRNYFTNHFKPVDFHTKQIHTEYGQTILADEFLFQQFVDMVKQEVAFLSANPDYLVVYHAAPEFAVCSYAMVNIWQAMLQEQLIQTWHSFPLFRFSTFFLDSFSTIHRFIKQMEELAKPGSKLFNYTNGYSERAIAGNMMLTGNDFCDASCTLSWYFEKTTRTRENYAPVIKDLLKQLGLEDGFQDRYVALFNHEVARLLKKQKSHSLLQQAFIPTQLLDENGYLCQIWGKRFKTKNIEAPSQIQKFIADPQNFEFILKGNQSVYFENYEGVENAYQGDFIYSGVLQIRLLSRAMHDPRTKVNTYVRHPAELHEFTKRLTQLVREDYAAFLYSSTVIPKQISASLFDKTTSARLKLGLYRDQTISDYSLLQQQRTLRQGLLDDPIFNSKHELISHLSRERKIKIQELLGDEREMSVTPNLHCLCQYIKGYTYYDLVCEILKKHLSKRTWTNWEEKYHQYIELINEFANPYLTHEKPFDDRYNSLHLDLRDATRSYKRDPKAFEYFPAAEADMTESQTLSFEICLAHDIVYFAIYKSHKTFKDSFARNSFN